MIKVSKDLKDVPDILTLNPTRGSSRITAFDANIASKKNVDKKNLYKVDSVQRRLKAIYFNKCAYCETNLLDASISIEHYRPKSIYYWLIYSWDNLLLACQKCNSHKNDKFIIKNNQAIYNKEPFDSIHRLSKKYDKSEVPYCINPEKDDVLEDIVFDSKAIISSLNPRVTDTIEKTCKLNRSDLVQKRIRIFNLFKKNIKTHWILFKKNGFKGKDRFKPDIESFLDECNVENDFYAFRYYIVKHIEVFFEDKHLVKMLKILINKYDEKGIVK